MTTSTNHRITREADTREARKRPTSWAPPESLPTPDKQPGYAYRWIRISTYETSDPANISAKSREGWEPVLATEQSNMLHLTGNNPRYKDNIEIGGLLLCKAPEEFMEQRDEYFRNKANLESASVESQFRSQENSVMPLFVNMKTKISNGFGSGI